MKKNLPTIIFISLIILVIGLVVYAISRPEDKPTVTNNSQRPQVEADVAKLSSGNSLGPADAKVTLTEFGDYQCPACGQYHKLIKDDILPKYSDKLKFVFLNFPLTEIHANAQAAAQAAEAAALQGKFWEMHNILYERQDDWSKQKDPRSKFEAYAREMGIDLDLFKKDSESQKVIDLINQQAGLGEAFKLKGTPSFFVNGTAVVLKAGSNDILQAIDKALAQ
ncbi:MAG: thioredoxin domain-containing protein [bacterium]